MMPRKRILDHGGTTVTGDVHIARGNFIGRDQYNITSQTITPQSLSSLEDTQPYFAGQPYRATDHLLFTGREVETDLVLQQLRDPESMITVIYGPAEVGKTSFIAAGVLPQLTQLGADIFPLQDYREPVPLLRALLWGRFLAGGGDIPANASTVELLQLLSAASERRLIVVLDQFERYFSAARPVAKRSALLELLVEATNTLPADFFHVLIAIRSEWQAQLDRQWGMVLPALRRSPVHLGTFTFEQAQTAIMTPLQKLRVKAVFDEDFLQQQLLPDLDQLSLEQAGSILPADLQLVAQFLYRRAEKRQVLSIKAPFYFKMTEGKGAEWILDRRFEGLVARVGGRERALATSITTELLALDTEWIEAEQISAPGRSLAEVSATLERMAEVDLLVWQLAAAEHRVYAFASNSIARAAERALGRELQKRLQARQTLEYAWRDWIRQGSNLRSHQLRLVVRYYQGSLPVERALLLLHSAVAARSAVQPWLEQLDTVVAKKLLQGLEDGELAAENIGLTRRKQAATILDLVPAVSNREFGAVTWTAVAHPQSNFRETAVLALLAVYEPAVLVARLKSAVERSQQGASAQIRRLAELQGMLLDVAPDIMVDLPAQDTRARWALWGWRFQRRFRRDIDYLALLTVGGGVGGGLGLGLLRVWVACLLHSGMGLSFYTAVPPGFMLGSALSLGLLLVNVLRLQPAEYKMAEVLKSRPWLQTSGLGAVFFALMYLAHVFLINWRAISQNPGVSLLGGVVGIGLSWVVHEQPLVDWSQSKKRWWMRLLAAMGLSSLVQWFLIAVGGHGAGLVYVWSAGNYRSHLGSALQDWSNCATLIDAALATLFLAAGVTLGLRWGNKAYRVYRTWKTLAWQED
ncbi:MAG: hypothetical protein U9Q70_04615 [Chloroflexota bacterium]|nr:hypothetical protein [Chloroflexota bacterium]